MQLTGPSNDAIANYRVQLGHLVVTVQGKTKEEALKEARRRLCDEMPRMWDVIHQMQDNQFQIATC